jgi:hypothetical protein
MFPFHTISMSNTYVQLGAQIASILELWNSISHKIFHALCICFYKIIIFFKPTHVASTQIYFF